MVRAMRNGARLICFCGLMLIGRTSPAQQAKTEVPVGMIACCKLHIY